MARFESLPFDFDIPMSVFEKAGAPEGRRRRIGGIASAENDDRQQESVLARGLDFSDFLSDGWFNDNHSKATDGILGYPEEERMFSKGETLPDGRIAKAAGHWVEGYLLEGHPPADRIWDLGKALAKTKRRLGFSVEGKIIKRAGMNKSGAKVVAKAKVRNVAITNCPVNGEARMEILVKSLRAVEGSDPSDLDKALTMGEATGINPPAGPQTGDGAGQVLTGQSLEHDEKIDKNKKKKKKSNQLSMDKAREWVRERLPAATDGQIERFIRLTMRLKKVAG